MPSTAIRWCPRNPGSVFPSGPGGEPDTAVIEGAQADITYQLGILDRALDGRHWLAGGMLTLADLFVVPILSYVREVPGGRENFAKARNVGSWLERIGERDSYQVTLPPAPGG
jgi:glutathione S-transferase